jgi:hypothetical protein
LLTTFGAWKKLSLCLLDLLVVLTQLSALAASGFAMKLAFATILCLIFVGCEQRRAAEVREFPDGFRGWAVIVWNVPGYPPLPTDNGKLIERFSADGVIITSTKQQFGWAHDQAYFVDAAGHRLPSRPNIAVEAVGGVQQGGRSMDYTQQFVGTKAELDAAPFEPPQIEPLFSRLHLVPKTTLKPN